MQIPPKSRDGWALRGFSDESIAGYVATTGWDVYVNDSLKLMYMWDLYPGHSTHVNEYKSQWIKSGFRFVDREEYNAT